MWVFHPNPDPNQTVMPCIVLSSKNLVEVEIETEDGESGDDEPRLNATITPVAVMPADGFAFYPVFVEDEEQAALADEMTPRIGGLN